jgi:hypothetical protein
MPKLYVKQSGTWKQVLRLWTKKGGVWSSPTAALITANGIGKQFYPDSTGISTYPTAGTFSYTVPAGVTSIRTTIVGGGGGGGGTYGNGDNHAGGSGGSGGYYSNQTIAVTPGEVLTLTVGARGLGGIFNFNANNWFQTPNSGTYAGSAGTASSISRGATALLTATGGGGGLSSGPGDNWNSSSGGTAGSPNGTAGVAGPSQRNSYGPAIGATNGTGYGSGGNSNSTVGAQAYTGGQWGTDGFISITPINANVVTFTSGSGNWTVPAGITSVTLTMIGGGGNGNANTNGSPGPGGGSAAYFSNVVVSVTPGANVAYSVGVAGATNNINPFQYDGSASTFGSRTAGGGFGGHWRSSNTSYPSNELAGEGGVATGAGGVNGTAGNNGGLYGGNGNGASSPYGAGGPGTGGTGGAATGFGAGGGGGGNNSGQGPGSNGFITLSW